MKMLFITWGWVLYTGLIKKKIEIFLKSKIELEVTELIIIIIIEYTDAWWVWWFGHISSIQHDETGLSTDF